MICLKKFENHEAYTAATLTLPNVSLCEQENEVHYNPYVDPYNGHEYVDLGLPSGKKWTKHFLGMSGDTDVENALYFAWGTTTGCTAADTGATPNDWAHAPYNNGSFSFDIAYWRTVSASVLDNGRTLKLEYDAAHAILGGDWRMPTKEECQELFNGTTRTVETIDNVEGMRFTSIADTSKSLFIPFIGYRYSSSVYSVGGEGGLWSSSLDVSSPKDAFELYAYSNENVLIYGTNRCNGRGVLGVIY